MSKRKKSQILSLAYWLCRNSFKEYRSARSGFDERWNQRRIEFMHMATALVDDTPKYIIECVRLKQMEVNDGQSVGENSQD